MVVSEVIQLKSIQVIAVILTVCFLDDSLFGPPEHCICIVQSQCQAPHCIISNGCNKSKCVVVLSSSCCVESLLVQSGKLICCL